MKRWFRGACALLLIGIFAQAQAATAFASNSGPVVPFSVVSEDDSVVFHFNPSLDPLLPATGLYFNTYPYEMIFQVVHQRDWRAYEHSFFFTSAMRHFAFMPPDPPLYGIQFFAHGELYESFRVNELVHDYEMLLRLANPNDWYESLEFDTTEARLTITTVDGVTYVFEISTGRIIYMSGSSSLALMFLFVAVLAVFFLGMRHFARRKIQSHSNVDYYGRQR